VIRILTLLVGALAVGALGHVYLRMGMKAIGEFSFSTPSTWLPYFWQVITSYHIILGVFLQAIFFGTWLILLSKADLSLLLPLTAIEYLIGAVFTHFILHENLSWLRVAGTFVVCIGVALICLDHIQSESESKARQIPEAVKASISVPNNR
jgi:drug/metabolite transporter (DMT)-like permease